MPKLGCPCGYVHNLSPIPDEGYVTVRDEEYEQLIEAHRITYEISVHDVPSEDHPRYREWEAAFDLTVSLTRRLYLCPNCDRIMWGKPDSEEFDYYHPGVGEVQPPPDDIDIPKNDNPEMEVVPYTENWVRCPSCGKRFSLLNPVSWNGKKHKTCGQSLSIRGYESDA